MYFMIVCVIATFAAMAFSAFWYAPKVMGNTWQKLSGVKCDGQKKGDCIKTMSITFLAYLAIALTLYSVIMWAGAATPKSGALIGLLTGSGFASMAVLVPYLWEGRNPRLFLMTAVNHILTFMLMGALIAKLVHY